MAHQDEYNEPTFDLEQRMEESIKCLIGNSYNCDQNKLIDL